MKIFNHLYGKTITTQGNGLYIRDENGEYVKMVKYLFDHYREYKKIIDELG